MKYVVLLLVLMGMMVVRGKAQTAYQDSVRVYMEKVAQSAEDSLKLFYNESVREWIGKMEAGTYDVNRKVKYLGYKLDMNSGAELFSWSVPMAGGAAFYNYFKFKDNRRDVLLQYLPGEKTGVPPYLFYDLWAFTSGKKEYFVLLGWSETKHTNRKAILIADFGSGGRVNFNRPLLKRGNSRSAVMTFEYGKGMSMMLKQERKGKRIIFDHLSPGDEKYEGAMMFYGPDGTYNSFELKKGIWVFKNKE